MKTDMIQYKLFHINDLTDEMIAKYYPMLSPRRQAAIASALTVEERKVLLSLEMLARQMLSQILHKPENSFSVLLFPDKTSCVEGNVAKLNCSVQLPLVLCTVSDSPCGCSVLPVLPFTFADAQNNCSDSELRWIFAQTGFTIADFVQTKACENISACIRYATLLCAKKAYFQLQTKVNSGVMRKNEMEFMNGVPIFADKQVDIAVLDWTEDKNFVYCAVKSNQEP